MSLSREEILERLRELERMAQGRTENSLLEPSERVGYRVMADHLWCLLRDADAPEEPKTP